MRVISGIYKGKKLESPKGDNVRPTSDRIKESMFNILYSRLDFFDIEVLDLFSGSGALGIEAISRGAKNCVFCDKSPQSLELTKINLKKLSIKNFEAYLADYAFALKKLEGRQFDLILVDPPYKEALSKSILELILRGNLLKEDGLLLFEHSTEDKIQILPEFEYDYRKMGNTSLTILKLKALK